jgi:hypothetical protein
VEVAPERVAGWFTRFADRHGGVTRTVTASGQVRVESADAVATLTVPFGQLPDAVATGLAVDPLVAHLLLPRRIGLLLVRIGGHSVGIAYHGRIEVSRTDRRLVQGRTAAGGWSQQRFARRRAGQARQALHAAATDAFEILGPALSTMTRSSSAATPAPSMSSAPTAAWSRCSPAPSPASWRSRNHAAPCSRTPLSAPAPSRSP